MATSHEISGRNRRTLETIFRHPVARNLPWQDALHLIETLGVVTQEHNGHLLLTVGGQREMFHQPHDKELTAEETAR